MKSVNEQIRAGKVVWSTDDLVFDIGNQIWGQVKGQTKAEVLGRFARRVRFEVCGRVSRRVRLEVLEQVCYEIN